MASQQVERKLVAILVSDVVGYSRMAGANEDLTLARLRALRSDLVDPIIAVYHGRVVKRTGDGSLVEFRSVVDAVRCAIEVQNGMVERNAGLPPDRRIEFRIGIHLGDVVEEADGDLMGDGVNIAARLEGIAQPGSICLSDDAYRHVKARLNLAVVDLGETQLKNIAEPMRIFSLEVGRLVQPALAAESSKMSLPASAPRLSIVVLPFANMGGNPEQEYFVDGVTESLTTDLSRISGSFVIGRNTAFTYKGKHVDLKHIGRELNVRYVLEGSVQRGGNRLRVNVQLIDSETGNHLWAERFDKPVADLFDMQDEIVARLANQLSAKLIEAEAQHAELTKSTDLDSLDLTFRGLAAFNRGLDPASIEQAEQFFNKALALDATNVDALAGLGLKRSLSAIFHVHSLTSVDRTAYLAVAETAAKKALRISPRHTRARLALATTFLATNRAAQSIVEFEETIALDQNQATAYAFIALAKVFLGRAEEIEDDIGHALRLSPRDTYTYYWFNIAGVAKLALGKDDEAISWFRRSADANRNNALNHFFLSAALAHQGQNAEAAIAAKAGLELESAFTIRRYREGAVTDNATYLAQRERFYEGMRIAGVPEG
jgi:TolB-like protein/class 3 adenylate cyclase